MLEAEHLVLHETWDNKLRAHHSIARLYRDQGVPPLIYCTFHFGLNLKSFEFDECINAWVKEAWGYSTEWYSASKQHVVLGDR
jgi:hypothetical protein